MNPFDVFDPSAALDPTRYAGQAGAARLLQAAQRFPGGPVALVLALFFAPLGPGVPAGVLLARHVPLTPAATFGLYALSDVIAAIDDRFIALVMIVTMIVIPQLARRFVPGLRPNARRGP